MTGKREAILDVFQDVPIPVDEAATQKYVTLGASDSGKTFMLARFAEQCAHAGMYFVLLDPVGKHWSLRAGPDGESGGGLDDVYVLGGLHGDVHLDPKSGELIADVVVDHPGRYVIDVSTFETDTEVHSFAAAFAKRLFRRKMKDPGWPMLLMLEESESFLPQVTQKGQEVMKGAFGRIVRQGRNHGLGVFLVFQRSAAGDKGAISQCKVLIAKQMSHNRDLTAVDDWVESNGTPEQRKEMLGALASMKVEEAFVWSPSWLRVFQRTRVLPRETFDSSANVKHGERMLKVELKSLDVDALGTKMTELAEQAKENDPGVLKKKLGQAERRIAELEEEVREGGLSQEHLAEFEARAILIDELREQLAKAQAKTRVPAELEDAVRQVGDALAGFEEEFFAMGDRVGSGAARLRDVLEVLEVLEQARDGEPAAVTVHHPPSEHTPPPALARPVRPSRPTRTSASQNGSTELSQTALEMLDFYVAFAPKPVSPEKMGVLLAKSSNSGPFRTAIRGLQERGYLSDDGATATQAASSAAQAPYIPSAKEVQERWRQRLQKDNVLMQQVFEVVLAAAPNGVTPEEIGRAIGKSPNSGPVRKAFKQLDSLQVCVYDRADGGVVTASPYLLRPRD